MEKTGKRVCCGGGGNHLPDLRGLDYGTKVVYGERAKAFLAGIYDYLTYIRLLASCYSIKV